jgi:hypothetical protein
VGARRLIPALLTAACLLAAAPRLHALDIGISGWAGNLGFRADRTAADAAFPGTDYFWGFSLYGSQAISDSIRFETGFYSDPVLRNTSYTLFTYSEKVLSVGIGPFFGFFNDTTTLLKSGISTAVKLELPGIAFVSFRSDSSIGGELITVGDYLQSRSDISLGFYVPNAICTLSLASRSFEQKQAAATVVDNLTSYGFSTDIFRKNVPYRLQVNFAWQTLSKSWVAATTTTASLNSIVIGAQASVNLTDTVLVQAGMEGTVYSFGTGTLLGGASPFLWRAFTGIQMSTDDIPFLQKIL